MASMSDWQIEFDDARNPRASDYDWAPIDSVVQRLSLLQRQASEGAEVSEELQDSVAELERHIGSALEHGASLAELGERTMVSQRDLARVRDTGRLYER